MLEEIRRTIGWFFVILLITMLVFFLALQSALLWQLFPSSGSFATFPGEKIAVLDLSGPIFEVQDKLDQIKRFREDETVRGLLVQVDSPGGAVGPSQELASAVRHFSRTTDRPVVTSIRSVGASGAYYVASSSDTIVANPGSIVGSIGVLVQFMEFKDLMGKIGVDYQVAVDQEQAMGDNLLILADLASGELLGVRRETVVNVPVFIVDVLTVQNLFHYVSYRLSKTGVGINEEENHLGVRPHRLNILGFIHDWLSFGLV